ncbi:hypothetical protein [Allonocardiopsis opalescens]|uniref:Uncharacterized protein n=1 Tax=Allonocardiopsis opalescens TaxID=1144618 RepID=A0A2T0Q775_9ACTN|nr:hypothetical protein [Allonocardiopsis opalescens]PRX99686.1 hypothetical protein CLV72_103291 [Allonocardiopsis opalescens]
MERLAARAPRRIGGYRLIGRLGAGWMGPVFLGRCARGRLAAVRMVRADYAGDIAATAGEVFVVPRSPKGRAGNPARFVERTYRVRATSRFAGTTEKILAAART